MVEESFKSIPGPRTSRSFYITGGTLRRDAECYVERKADGELLERLKQGQFCYVLTSRQMGKSSLMVRAASRLREEGFGVAVLDLTAIGQNVNAEQWYGGLLSQMAQQLDLEDELFEFWERNMSLGPLHRWLQAIRRVVLSGQAGPVIVFVDEIDAVLGLPFSTDEFFAGVRELYNFRTVDAELGRLTFCLLGVASPSDLIRDTRVTPFNIGQRIELRDFADEEAWRLSEGLRRDPPLAGALLGRILHWTGGHPYLTQRLCKAVADDGRVTNGAGVDLLCEEIFFARRASEQDDNLLFVRELMLRSDVDLAELLTLYAGVLRGKRFEDEEANPLITTLRLSGVARVEGGSLKPRNRIYARVFDRAWIAKHMPDAEVRRQRAAYRRGVIRAGVIAALLIALIGALLFTAVKKNALANEQMEAYRRVLYAAQMNLAQQNWEFFSAARVLGMLDEQAPKPGQEDLRGFEWYYLWRLCHSERATLRGGDVAYQAVFSPDGRQVAAAAGNAVKLWDAATGAESRTFEGHANKVASVAFSPDGGRLATAALDGTVKLWDVTSGRELATFAGHEAALLSVAFAPDGRRLASLDVAGVVKLWSAETRRDSLTLKLNGDRSGAGVSGLTFSPDGKLLAIGAVGCKVWDVATGKQRLDLLPGKTIGKPRFSPDGRWLAVPGNPTVIFETASGKEVMTLGGHFDWVFGVAFTPDGGYLATASRDQSVKLWETRSWQPLATIKGHSDTVASVEFSPSGGSLVTASFDKTVKLWNVTPLIEQKKLTQGTTFTLQELPAAGAYLSPVAFSPSGDLLASAVTEHLPDGTVKSGAEVGVWNLATGAQILKLAGNGAAIRSLAFTADGRGLFTGDSANAVKMWDAATGRFLRDFTGHTGDVSALSRSDDGRFLVSGATDRVVKVWDVGTGGELRALTGHSAPIVLVIFAPMGRQIASVGADGEVRVWEIATGRKISTLKLPRPIEYGLPNLIFSPDGRSLVTADGAAIRQLDVATGREVRMLTGHAKDVSAMTFSPDGKRLASVGEDRALRLWDWATGRELAALRTEINPVAIGFARDGLTLTTLTSRYYVKQWHAASAAEVLAAGK